MVVKDKVLYVYLRISPTMIVTPMFFDNHAILYEPMEDREVQDLTWHGLPIPELALKPTSSPSKRDLNKKWVMDSVVPNASKAASSRAGTQNVGGSTFPNALTAPPLEPFSSFVPTTGGTEAHEVPLPIPSTIIPTMRTSAPREETSIPFSIRSPSEPRKVRPFDF